MSAKTSFVLFVLLAATPAAGAVRPPCPAAGGDEFFFPAGLLEPADTRGDLSRRRWYGKFLQVMGEPSLSCGGGGDEVYRFLYLPSRSAPVAVRVARSAQGAVRVVAVELTGAGGFRPGKIDTRTDRALPTARWRELQAALGAAGFWTMTTAQRSHGKDGERWIVEGRRGQEYHVVDRWSPRRNAYQALGELFRDLGDV